MTTPITFSAYQSQALQAVASIAQLPFNTGALEGLLKDGIPPLTIDSVPEFHRKTWLALSDEMPPHPILVDCRQSNVPHFVLINLSDAIVLFPDTAEKLRLCLSETLNPALPPGMK